MKTAHPVNLAGRCITIRNPFSHQKKENRSEGEHTASREPQYQISDLMKAGIIQIQIAR